MTPCVTHLLFILQTKSIGQITWVGCQLVAAKVSPIQISREAWDEAGWLLNGGTWSGNERGRLTVTGKWKRKKVAKQCLSHGHCEDAAAPPALFSFPPLIFTPGCSLVFTWSHPFSDTLNLVCTQIHTDTPHPTSIYNSEHHHQPSQPPPPHLVAPPPTHTARRCLSGASLQLRRPPACSSNLV